MLVDHVKAIQGVMDVYMNWAWSRVSLVYMSMVGFKSIIIIWIE